MPSGKVKGLRGRGNVIISITWQNKKISTVKITFSNLNHPSFQIIEDVNNPGYYHANRNAMFSSSLDIEVSSPNVLSIYQEMDSCINAEWQTSGRHE